jgi:hypothetical protein
MKLQIAAPLLLLAFYSFSQKKDTVLITAGNTRLQSYLLKDYIASYDFFSIKEGVETRVGDIAINFQVFPKKNQALLVCNIKFGSNTILDSGLCVLKGLSPIYHRSYQTRKSMMLDFAEGNVNGKVILKDDTENKTEKVNYQPSAPLFDSFYEDIIAKTLDPETSGLFKFPEYIYERGGTVWSVGEILKGEKPSETIVKFYELNSKKEVARTTTYVIDTLTREILKREYAMGSNKILMRKKV